MTDTSTQPTGAPDRSADEVIRTVDLTKVYPGDVKAVDQLNLAVYRGEIFGLLGPNGAGKTTTAGMLTTRVVPTAGRAFVGGVDVWAHPAKAKSLIGVVPQTNTLDRSLTVWENLYYHGRFFGMNASKARSEADDMLARFKLTERATMPVLALVGRHGPTADGGPRGHASSVGAVPRRADRRPRSAGSHRDVGDPRRPPHRRADDPAHHALHGRGRSALQARGHHRPRQGARPRHAREPQEVDRHRHQRHRHRGRRSRGPGRSSSSERSRARPPRWWSTGPCASA